MSIPVNPPPQLRLPDEFIKNPQIRSYFEQQNRILFQLWNRTGGNDDLISTAVQSITNIEFSGTDSKDLSDRIDVLHKELSFIRQADPSLSSKIDDLQRELSLSYRSDIALEEGIKLALMFGESKIDNDFQLISTGSAYTTTKNQIIVVTSNVTITLNANPKNKEIAVVKRNTAAGAVTVSAGSKTIDGAASISLATNYDSAICLYSYPNDEWFTL